MKIFLAFLLMIPLQAIAQVPFWVQTGGPEGGSVYSIASNARCEVIVGTHVGPAYSSDTGRTWISSRNIPVNQYVAVGINNVGILFAGSPSGLFTSSDKGNSWLKATSPLGSAWVYSAGFYSDDTLFVGTDASIYRSIDCGKTWLCVDSGFGNIFGLAFDLPHGAVYAATMAGVRRSVDHGTTWSSAGPLPGSAYLLITVSMTGSVFVTNYINLYRSTDTGLTWHTDTTWFHGASIGSIGAANDSTIFVAATPGLMASTDDGSSWTQVSHGFPDNGTGIGAMCITNSEIILAGSTSGIIISYDRGIDWQFSNSGLNFVPVTIVSPLANEIVYASTQFSGIYRSADRGARWSMLPQGSFPGAAEWGGYTANFHFANTRHGSILASTPGIVFRSTDGGCTWDSSWDAITNGLSPYTDVTAFRSSPSGDVYAGTWWSILKSTDDGESWISLDPRAPVATYGTVPTFDVAANGNLVAAVDLSYGETFRDYVFKSTDGGYHWSGADSGLGLSVFDRAVIGLSASPDGDLFALLRSSTTGTMLYQSTNTGTFWSRVPFDSSKAVRGFCINADNEIFVLTDSVYLSFDKGRTWVATNSGLGETVVNSISLAPDGFLYAATRSSVFRSAVTTTSVRLLPSQTQSSVSLWQSYPNPFNSSATIRYFLSSSLRVHLTVYDVLGREVSVLVDERKNAGTHSVAFDGTKLSSGIYFYRLQAGASVVTKKLVLLK